jgi:RND family efflux transporter MFP subunit
MPCKYSLAGKMRAALVFAFALCMSLTPPASAQTPQASLVRVEDVQVETMNQTVPIVGRLVSLRMGDVAARIDGPVDSIMVEVGDRVKQGQVIAALDSETLQAELNLAKSELKEAEAELNTWRAEAEVANTELRRQEGLKQSVAFSQAKFEDAQKRAAVAAARIERARANVAIKRTSLERKQIDVEYSAVRAPYPGVVMRRYTEAGAFVNKGAPVVRLIGDRQLEVEAYVPNSRLGGLPVGRVVEFALDDGSKHKATVRSILPSENPQTRTRAVRLVPEFSQTTRPLADSQSVVVSVPVSTDRQVVTVHKDAILKRPNGDMVYVVKNNVAELRPVKLGEAVGSRFEVLAGLKKGDTVVTRGNERIQPGARVRVEKDSS